MEGGVIVGQPTLEERLLLLERAFGKLAEAFQVILAEQATAAESRIACSGDCIDCET
jgi:hypothetical protein